MRSAGASPEIGRGDNADVVFAKILHDLLRAPVFGGIRLTSNHAADLIAQGILALRINQEKNVESRTKNELTTLPTKCQPTDRSSNKNQEMESVMMLCE